MKKTKKFKAELLAFLAHGQDIGQVREVEVPAHMLSGNPETDLQAIFVCGQNDFQPLQCRSVSVCDVIHYEGKTYMVNDIGFLELGHLAYMGMVRGLQKMAEKVYAKPCKVLTDNREKFPVHREKFPVHREKFPVHRNEIKN